MNRKIVAFMLILAIVLGVVNTPQIIAEAKTTSKVKSIKIINPKKASLKLKVGSKFKLKIKIKPKAASKTSKIFFVKEKGGNSISQGCDKSEERRKGKNNSQSRKRQENYEKRYY